MIGKHFIIPYVITRMADDGELWHGNEIRNLKRNLFFARPTNPSGEALDGMAELLICADQISKDELFDARPSTKNITVK